MTILKAKKILFFSAIWSVSRNTLEQETAVNSCNLINLNGSWCFATNQKELKENITKQIKLVNTSKLDQDYEVFIG